MKIVLLNGPPRSGKDFAARALMRHFQPSYFCRWERFSLPNKLAFAGMAYTDVIDDRTDPDEPPGYVFNYEPTKEEVIPWLGCSFRQWQIDFSEKFMKPLYGPDIFVRLFYERNRLDISGPSYLCFVSDCGFQVEYDALAALVPPEDLLLLQLHREGCDFSKDSREWVTPHYEHPTRIKNFGDETFAPAVISIVEQWLG